MRPKKLLGLYDLWSSEGDTTKSKPHPSKKRSLKTPLPHPGQSYNPDPVDHSRLLKKIAEAEMKHRKRQATINEAVRVKFSAEELREHEKQQLEAGIKHLIPKATSSDKKGVVANDADSDGSSTDSAYSDYDEKDFEAIIKEKRVEEKRKTRKQRLAQLRDKLQRKAAKLKKAKNIRLSKIDAIKKITKELDYRDKELAARHKRRSRRAKKERLGTKFEQSDPIYCLSSELPSSLRETKCSMDAIVREQLESFQSRLMVEPTNFQVKKRKYKRKTFERNVDDADYNVGPIDYKEE